MVLGLGDTGDKETSVTSLTSDEDDKSPACQRALEVVVDEDNEVLDLQRRMKSGMRMVPDDFFVYKNVVVGDLDVIHRVPCRYVGDTFREATQEDVCTAFMFCQSCVPRRYMQIHMDMCPRPLERELACVNWYNNAKDDIDARFSDHLEREAEFTRLQALANEKLRSELSNIGPRRRAPRRKPVSDSVSASSSPSSPYVSNNVADSTPNRTPPSSPPPSKGVTKPRKTPTRTCHGTKFSLPKVPDPNSRSRLDVLLKPRGIML